MVVIEQALGIVKDSAKEWFPWVSDDGTSEENEPKEEKI